MALTKAIVQFLRNPNTQPPLTLAIAGEWGSGKSSLLALIREELLAHDLPVVWFNAWQHESEQDLLAALLERLRHAVPPWWRLRGIIFHGRLLGIRMVRRHGLLVALTGIVTLASGYLAANPNASLAASIIAWAPSWEEIRQSGKGVWLWLIAASPVLALLISLADLLSKGRTLSGRVGRRELRRKRDFRTRVSEDFYDIAQAFKPRTLTLLIDNLDRCRPKAVTNVLEATNFLVSVGDCFVVIGMAREAVERSIRVHLSTIAEELSADHVQEKETSDDTSRRLRELSKRYLDRLINMEVALPTPAHDRAWGLIAGLPSQGSTVQPATIRRNPLRTMGKWVRTHASFVRWGMVLLIALAVGVGIGNRFPLLTADTPAFAIGGIDISWFVAAWFLSVAAVPSLAGIYLLARLFEARLFVEDPPDFRDALAVWTPLIFRLVPTPRDVKRLLNNERLLAALAGKNIPVANVVALLVLRKLSNAILEGDDIDRKLADFLARSENADLRERVAESMEAHRKRFGHWPPPPDQVKQFRETGLFNSIRSW